MDLRDYFAARAMQGLLAKDSNFGDFDEFAEWAYKQADAMLEARKVGMHDESNDGWIEWNGGECPVELDSYVECKLRNGREQIELASKFRWWWVYERPDCGIDKAYDIISYRIVK